MTIPHEAEPAATHWERVRHRSAAAYQEHFDALAEAGADVHGEARFVMELVGPGARVLDAGCGTGRVATQLTAWGYDVVGVDLDEEMIGVARQRDPHTRYVVADLSTLYLRTQTFSVIVMAGNVIPLLAPGTLHRTLERLYAHLRPGGLLVAGFGLDAAHLPRGCPATPLADVDRAASLSGLAISQRYATWDREPWTAWGGYAVTVWQRHG